MFLIDSDFAPAGVQVAQPAQLREGQPFSEPQAPSRVQVGIWWKFSW